MCREIDSGLSSCLSAAIITCGLPSYDFLKENRSRLARVALAEVIKYHFGGFDADTGASLTLSCNFSHLLRHNSRQEEGRLGFVLDQRRKRDLRRTGRRLRRR